MKKQSEKKSGVKKTQNKSGDLSAEDRTLMALSQVDEDNKFNAQEAERVSFLDVVPEGLRVRLALGNGLRPEVWHDFQDGFAIAEVLEFFAATEGNGSLFNLCALDNLEARGKIGRQGAVLKWMSGFFVAEFDVNTEELKRNKSGHCIHCPTNRPGELLMPIVKREKLTRFSGYADQAATDKKIAENVVHKGDRFFRTGDLIARDSRGFYTFYDRIGDTFRWKGENVSTQEVSECIGFHPAIDDANVYGVKVPAQDGRACCVGVMLALGFDFDDKVRSELMDLHQQLPTYARPRFYRIHRTPPAQTGTFKQQKVALREQGCDPSKITPSTDELWYVDGSLAKSNPSIAIKRFDSDVDYDSIGDIVG